MTVVPFKGYRHALIEAQLAELRARQQMEAAREESAAIERAYKERQERIEKLMHIYDDPQGDLSEAFQKQIARLERDYP